MSREDLDLAKRLLFAAITGAPLARQREVRSAIAAKYTNDSDWLGSSLTFGKIPLHSNVRPGGSMNGWQSAASGESVKVADLGRIYRQNRSRSDFPEEVTSLLEQLDTDIAWRALWLMCRLADEGALGRREQERLVECVDASRHWAWRLLVCQLLARITCLADLRDDLFPFLLDCFRDRRPIVRAWALTAMWRFREDERYRTEILRCMRDARKDTAKAMIARVRLLAGPNKAPKPRRRSRTCGNAKRVACQPSWASGRAS